MNKIPRELRRIGRQIKRVFIKEHKGMSDAELESDRAMYERLNTDTRFKLGKKYDFICRFDKYAPNGSLDNQYFIQDIWGARKVYENMPSVHYDVGSYVAGFIAHLLGMKQKIVLIDIRKMNNNFDTNFLKEPRSVNGGGQNRDSQGGIEYICADATNLENIADESIESLSALCSVEHFGLGRYGDPINPNAWEQALKSFQRVLKKGGKLYFSVPVGQTSKVCFNAHRVFHPEIIIQTLDSMQLLEFGYIDGFDVKNVMRYESNELKINQNALDSIPEYDNNGTTGLFEFVKI